MKGGGSVALVDGVVTGAWYDSTQPLGTDPCWHIMDGVVTDLNISVSNEIIHTVNW